MALVVIATVTGAVALTYVFSFNVTYNGTVSLAIAVTVTPAFTVISKVAVTLAVTVTGLATGSVTARTVTGKGMSLATKSSQG